MVVGFLFVGAAGFFGGLCGFVGVAGGFLACCGQLDEPLFLTKMSLESAIVVRRRDVRDG